MWVWFTASSQKMLVGENNLGEGPGEGEGRQVRGEGGRGRREISGGNKGQRVSMPKWKLHMINPNFALPFGAP